MKLFCCLVLALALQTSVLALSCQNPNSMNCILFPLTSLDGSGADISLPDLSKKTSLQIKGGNLAAFGEKLSSQLGSVQKLQLGPLGLKEMFLKADLLEVTAADNQIHVVKFKSSAGKYLLEKLDLRSNQLKHLSGFEVLVELSELLLEDNQLETVDFGIFEHMKKLKKLNLDRNHITKLEAIRMINLPNLEYMSLAGNRLTKINVSMWKFDSLTTWDVSSNDLIYVDGLDVRQQFQSLNVVMLAGNGWHCKWLTDSLKMFGDNSVRVGDKDQQRHDCKMDSDICCYPEELFDSNGAEKLKAIETDQTKMREELSKKLEDIRSKHDKKLDELKKLLEDLKQKSNAPQTAPSEPFNGAEFNTLRELAVGLKASIQNEMETCNSRSASNANTVRNLEYTILQLRKSLQHEVNRIAALREQFKLLRDTTNQPNAGI